jgi:hypothetical protein
MITNIANTTNNAPAFGASLKIDTAIKDAKRLKNIQKLFAEKTARYPRETLRLSLNEDTLSLQGTILNSKRETSCHILPRTMDQIMENLTDNEVAKKLVRLFKGLKVEDKAMTSIVDLEKQHEHLINMSKLNKTKAKAFKATGDIKMSNIYRTLADKNLKQAEKINLKGSISDINARYLKTLEKISSGDEDLMSNYNVVSSIL